MTAVFRGVKLTLVGPRETSRLRSAAVKVGIWLSADPWFGPNISRGWAVAPALPKGRSHGDRKVRCGHRRKWGLGRVPGRWRRWYRMGREAVFGLKQK